MSHALGLLLSPLSRFCSCASSNLSSFGQYPLEQRSHHASAAAPARRKYSLTLWWFSAHSPMGRPPEGQSCKPASRAVSWSRFSSGAPRVGQPPKSRPLPWSAGPHALCAARLCPSDHICSWSSCSSFSSSSLTSRCAHETPAGAARARRIVRRGLSIRRQLSRSPWPSLRV